MPCLPPKQVNIYEFKPLKWNQHVQKPKSSIRMGNNQVKYMILNSGI
jgi:hypothetical protein